ncbi:MAG: protein translocase subunit SecF [Acidimicrobiia bacterium]|nr:protein translocase subunit SecF [Acidimicrobiia bacterium]MBT8246899.1 protein translocase subunit SecF [Acidimicrobiia bacterium]NNJ47105.1 protein translocase subunit SecF [Acidimicrobiia bacterium]RZV46685.1 MAG: protein translocase subunit SecF [Acidimicrobiia bacterium]
MSVVSRLYRNETEFDFVGRKRIGFTISAILLTLSIGSLLVRGLNLGVDFEGGTVIEVTNEVGATVTDVRDALRPFGLETATVQLTSSVDIDGIRVESEIIDDLVERENVVSAVSAVAGVDPTAANVTAVGPAFGQEITESAIRALIIFLIVVALFIAWRFEWKMALAGLAALFHDLILTAGVYSITGFEVTPSTVIAILTILGYSLYDTVVVFDKIVETVEISQGRRSLAQIINDSMNTVLMRSLNTSLTSLLPVGSLLFVGSILLGATTLREFALALFVGVAAGTYSSIFVAAPFLATWKANEPEWQEIETAPAPKPEHAPPPKQPKKPKQSNPKTSPAGPPATGPKPRPPKKGRGGKR